MRNEISDLEHHELFLNPLKKLRHEIEELNKMLESRIEILTKPLCDSDLNQSSYKTMRSETFKSIESIESFYRLICRRVSENIEKSFQKIEEAQKVNEE